MTEPATSIIVSGFPRTGTTTMMRILHYGGIPVLADAETQDMPMSEFAPYGSYELKSIGQQVGKHAPEWMAGKAIKIVAPYLHWLDMGDSARVLKVIFMLRDEAEIISSLLAMRTIWNHSPSETVKVARELLEQHQVPVHYVQYHDMVKYPRATVIGVQDFLGAEFALDITKAVSAVDRKPRTRVTGVRQSEGVSDLLLFQGKVEQVVQ